MRIPPLWGPALSYSRHLPDEAIWTAAFDNGAGIPFMSGSKLLLWYQDGVLGSDGQRIFDRSARFH
jgi:hypothetical protein